MIRKVFYSAVVFLSMNAFSMSYVFQKDKGLEISWQTDDRIGITTGVESYGYTEQLCFWASSSATSQRNVRNFYATGYKLKDAATYYAYSPYRWIANFNARNIQCSYDGQIQHGNANTSHLAPFDHQLAAATVAGEACAFRLQHIGGVIRVAMKAKEAMTITSLALSTEKRGNTTEKVSAIATTATINLISQQTALAAPVTTITLQTDELTIEKDGLAVFYIALPAQNLSDYALSIDLTDANGATHNVARLIAPDIKPSCLYDIDLTKAPASGVQASSGVQPSSASGVQASPLCVERAHPSPASGVLASSLCVEGAPALAAAVATPTAYAPDILLDRSFVLERLPLPGDVNSDGIIDHTDADLIVQHYLGTLPDGAPFNPAAADLNNDGAITISDANAIINIIAK